MNWNTNKLQYEERSFIVVIIESCLIWYSLQAELNKKVKIEVFSTKRTKFSLFLSDFRKMEFDLFELEALSPTRSLGSTPSSSSSSGASRGMATPINLFGDKTQLSVSSRAADLKSSTPVRLGLDKPEAFPILRLPDCVLHIVLGFLSYDQVAQLRIVCRTLDQVCTVAHPLWAHCTSRPAASFVGGCAGQVVGCSVAPLLL